MSKKMVLEEEVAALGDLSREELAERWTKTYGHPPPKGSRRDFLLRAATWRLQASKLGGLSTDTRRLLRGAMVREEQHLVAKRTDVAAIGSETAMAIASSRKQLARGTRLIRDWNGRSHVVDVLEEGFAFEGKLHKSLTAIARQITGAHWSGPRFFGL